MQTLEEQRAYYRAWAKKNRVKRTASHRSWLVKNPDYYRNRYVTHLADERAYQRAWAMANRVKRTATHRAWVEANREKARGSVSARRARLAGAAGTHTTQEWLDKCALLGNVCVYCGQSKPLTRDHKIPLIRGGSNHIANVVPACGSCNSRKGRRTATEYMAFRLAA